VSWIPQSHSAHITRALPDGVRTADTHFFHTLALGVIGALCEACRLGKMYRYREKIIIRIIGQPLFGAELHHYEQARCRVCGHVYPLHGPVLVGAT